MGEKDDMLLPPTKIHNKLFDALFAWLARYTAWLSRFIPPIGRCSARAFHGEEAIVSHGSANAR